MLPVKLVWAYESDCSSVPTCIFDVTDTPPPPAGWRDAEFDDHLWARSSLVWANGLACGRFACDSFCLRGRFEVTDPRAVRELTLKISYRGGVVVHLNGREVARGHMPGGDPARGGPAEPYPASAWTPSAGDAERGRELGPVRLPTDALRKGVNVLAVEVRRSDYDPAAIVCLQKGKGNPGKAGFFAPVGIAALSLQAEGAGVLPNAAPSSGLQIWNQSVNDRVSVLDYGDPGEELRPVRIFGCKNGTFSGQIVLGASEAVEGLKIATGELKAAEGPGVIPADAVSLLYARQDCSMYKATAWFDGLSPRAPEHLPGSADRRALQPVLIKVRVPGDAPAGAYRGTLSVSAEGIAPRSVEVHLRVADWALPDPADFRTHASLYQSPESLALQYKVPMWSEEHWKLVERSFQLLGEVGNDLVQIPIVNRTQLGNDQGWVYWVKRADGPSTGSGPAAYDYDFEVFDRYVALARKYLGRPRFVCLHVWRSPVYGFDCPKYMGKLPHHVTELDPATGRLAPLQVPAYGTPESLAFWKPALLAIRKRLAEAGLEESLCLGTLVECDLPKELTEFQAILPEAGWTKGCHAIVTGLKPVPTGKGSRIVLQEYAYPVGYPDPARGLPQIWQQDGPGVYFSRYNPQNMSLLSYRTLQEHYLYRKSRGIGRIGLDYFPTKDGAVERVRSRGFIERTDTVYDRWPESRADQRSPDVLALTWPDEGGAAPTLRFEALREGVQNAEALLLLYEAQGEHAEKLGPELTDEVRRLLAERVAWLGVHRLRGGGSLYHVEHLGWDDMTWRLYDAAARVSARLGRGKGA